jgi:hypothetical protein
MSGAICARFRDNNQPFDYCRSTRLHSVRNPRNDVYKSTGLVLQLVCCASSWLQVHPINPHTLNPLKMMMRNDSDGRYQRERKRAASRSADREGGRGGRESTRRIGPTCSKLDVVAVGSLARLLAGPAVVEEPVGRE